MSVGRSPPGTPRVTRQGTTEAAAKEAAEQAAQGAEAILRDNADTLLAASTGSGQRLSEVSRQLEYLLNDKRKFTKADSMVILELFNEVNIDYIRMAGELEHYKGQVAALEKEQARPRSFASVAATRTKDKEERKRERSTSARRLPIRNRNTLDN